MCKNQQVHDLFLQSAQAANKLLLESNLNIMVQLQKIDQTRAQYLLKQTEIINMKELAACLIRLNLLSNLINNQVSLMKGVSRSDTP